MTAVTYFYNVGGWWCRAHKAGCKDITREARKRPGTDTYDTEVGSLRDLVEEVAHDFIFWNERNPWTDYEGEVSLAPCLMLPRETQPDLTPEQREAAADDRLAKEESS